MSSDLYRDYSNEILKRPLPKLEPPPPTLFAMKNEKMVNIVEQQRPSSSSTIINVPQQPSSSSAAGNHRKQQWKANVNSAISGKKIMKNFLGILFPENFLIKIFLFHVFYFL